MAAVQMRPKDSDERLEAHVHSQIAIFHPRHRIATQIQNK